MAEYKSKFTGQEIDAGVVKANDAVKPNDNISKLTNDVGYLTEHQPLKTINDQSIIGYGNIVIEGGSGTSDYEDLDNKPSINNVELNGEKSLEDLGIQEALVSEVNIKTINGNSVLGEGNLVIEGGQGGLTSVAHDATMEGAGTNESPLKVADSVIYDDTEIRGAIAAKQDTLVSGSNIKTINSYSILGEGNIVIEGGGGTVTNGWAGKVVSILGDSISTFQGYVPVADGHNLNHRVRYSPANASWYFAEGGTVDDTYWKKLINSLGAKLGINDSWAGSRVSNSSTTNTGDVGPDACMASITRITNLGANGTPDLILYYGGTNDAGGGVTVGSFNSNTTYTTDLTTKTWSDFATAYKDSIMRLQYYYPYAKILVLLPMYCTSYYNMGNLDKYNEQIKAICDYFGVEYVDLRRCGVNGQNLGTMLGDGIHPKVAGFNEMFKYIKNQLLSMYSNDGVENVVYSVTNNLVNNTNTDRYIKGVSAGKPYSATITGNTLTGVKVSMGGTDVTSTVYNSTTGVINITNVTGNVIISEEEVQTYSITTNVTGGTATGATIVAEGGNATVYITPNAGYELPSSITVAPSGATYTYDAQSGTINLTNVSADITITVACDVHVPEVYGITTVVSNGTYSGDATITEGSTATVIITADTGYKLPTTITVTNATDTYDNVTGTITLSNPSGSVSISAVCEEDIPEPLPTLVQGYWSQKTGVLSNRVCNETLIQGIQTITTKPGYVIRAVYSYPAEYSFPHTETITGYVMEAETSTERTSYTTLNANKWYGVTFTKTDANADILPTEDIVDSWVIQTPDITWYTSAPQDKTTAVNVKGYGWAPTTGIKSLITGVPVDVISFASTLNSGSMEIGVGTSADGITNWTIDSSRTYTMTWDSSNKDGNIVTVDLPEAVTLGTNEYFVVYPNTEPETGAFIFGNPVTDYEFTSDIPTSRRGQSQHNNPSCNLQFNFGKRNSN